MNNYEVFNPDDVVLQQGTTLREAKLAYKTCGTLNEEKSSTILYKMGAPGVTSSLACSEARGPLW